MKLGRGILPSQSISKLQTDIKWIVTGTPVYNSLADFITLCQFLGIPQDFVQHRHNEIKDIYILRRTKDDLALHNARLQLPPCHFENVELEMYDEEKALYQQVFLEAQGAVAAQQLAEEARKKAEMRRKLEAERRARERKRRLEQRAI